MLILMLSTNDPAGSIIRTCRAIECHTRHRARLVTLETRYNHNFTKDIYIPDADDTQLNELSDLFQSCDVMHFHMATDEFTCFGPFMPADYLPGKLIIHHHHGHPDFRANPEQYRTQYKERCRRNLLVSTPDLLNLLPEAVWQPNIVPVDDPSYSPVATRVPGPLRIGQSPTNKALKNTDEFIRVTDSLACDAALPANARVLITDVPHTQCLRIKRNCDIFFDHMQGYFGLSSLEALSQGIPTVAGIDEWNKAHIEAFSGRDIPWVFAQEEDSLKSVIRELLLDDDLRIEKGEESRKFMLEGWNEAKAVARLMAFYDRAEG